jgi:hypothetical protein
MFKRMTLALVATATLGTAPAFAADQVTIPPSGADYNLGVSSLLQAPRVTARERRRLEQIRDEYTARVDADKTKLAALMKQYRDMQAHYAPVPQQIKVHDQIVALSDDIKAANKAAWAKAARLLEGKVVLVNQGGGGGTVVVPGETKTIVPPKQIDPNAHPEQVPSPKKDYTHP